MTARRFRIASGQEELSGVLHLPTERPCACVVACHGLGASKDSNKYLLIADRLTGAGLGVARFDFRGSGESGGRPADATIATRVADLEAVLEYLAQQPELDGRFALLGSSLGGFVALFAATRRPGLPVVTWNAPADLRDVAVGDPDGPGGPGAALVAEVRAGRFAEAPPGVSQLLVIQSGRDEVVPPRHGHALYERAAAPKHIQWIPDGDHRLTDASHLDHAVEVSGRWLSRHLALAPA